MAESITIGDVYREIKKIETNMITRKEMDGLLETIEILSDPKLMKEIRKGENDIKEGNTTEFSEIKELL